MPNLTLHQVFGTNAYQDSTRIVINKLDYSNLSSSVANTGESLLVAIMLNAYKNFVGNLMDENNTTITNELGIAISYNNSALYDLLTILYWKRQFLQGSVTDTFVVESNEIQ